MAGFDEEHFSSVAVITLDPNAINSLLVFSSAANDEHRITNL
jgi:hypothetical protein